jgi:hypothetical protein
MRIHQIGILAGLLLATIAAAVDGDPYIGTWAGTWEGGGTGRFELTFQLGSDGKLTGGVAVGTDMGDYTAKFTKISFAGNKLTATYDYPLDTQGEVSVSGTFDASKASGTWGLGAKGQSDSQAMASGTWTIAKK